MRALLWHCTHKNAGQTGSAERSQFLQQSVSETTASNKQCHTQQIDGYCCIAISERRVRTMRWLVLMRLPFSRKRRLSFFAKDAYRRHFAKRLSKYVHLSSFKRTKRVCLKEFASKTRQMRQTQPDNTHTVHCFNSALCVRKLAYNSLDRQQSDWLLYTAATTHPLLEACVSNLSCRKLCLTFIFTLRHERTTLRFWFHT